MIVPINLRQKTFTGNGTFAECAFNFSFLQDSDLLVTEVDALGVETVHVLYTGYTVYGAGLIQGGSVTLLAGNLATGHTLIVERKINPVQTRSIPNHTAGYQEVTETALAHLTMLAQEYERILGAYDQNGARVPKLPPHGVDGSSYYDFRSNRGANADDPVDAQDLATKNYVDAAVAGVGGGGGGGGSFVFATVTSGGLPVAGVSFLNKVYYVKDPGLPGLWKVCGQQSGGGYEWVVLGAVSS